jgi:AraC-like DNA-binding protein
VRLNGERLIVYAPAEGFSIEFEAVGALHLIDAGDLVVRLGDGDQLEQVGAGDVVLLPRGDRHTISAARRRNGVAAEEPARWLCGTFAIGDPQASHLLANLPAAVVLRGGGGPALEGLEVARRMLSIEMESPSQGSAVMIARILDLLFIQILRARATSSEAEPGWLAGALDPQIGMALSGIHRDPAHDWTVEELAKRCNMSRSAFAAQFVARVGSPPSTYLTRVRLDAASDLLRHTSLPVSLVAERVGYLSEAAFSRAFKRRYEMPPARWRSELRVGSVADAPVALVDNP